MLTLTLSLPPNYSPSHLIPHAARTYSSKLTQYRRYNSVYVQW